MTKDDARDNLLSQLEFINELVMDSERNDAMYVYSLDAIERMRYEDYETIKEYLSGLMEMVSEKYYEIKIARRLLGVMTGEESMPYGYVT
ncbi:MAG: hypothetical protein WBK28_00285 [Minisyncoccia bacterium]